MYFVSLPQQATPTIADVTAIAGQHAAPRNNVPVRLVPIVLGGDGAVPAEMRKVMAIPTDYRFGACQAINYVAYSIGYKFAGACERYDRISPLPDNVGLGSSIRSIYDWISILAAQLPPGATVTIDAGARVVVVGDASLVTGAE